MTKSIYRIIISFSLLLFTFTSIAQISKYYDYSGKFKIQFPSTPTVTPTPVGDYTMYQFMCETATAALMVSYVDYPADQVDGQNKRDILDRAKNGFNGALKIITTDSLFITYGKHQGLLFHAEGSGMFCSMRDYMVDNRLYQLGILQMTAISVDDENNFFDSFELVK